MKNNNWEQNKIEAKSPLDFCYVFGEKEKSEKFKYWEGHWNINGKFFKATSETISLAKVNNIPDIYSIYYTGEPESGIWSNDSDILRVRFIPNDSQHLGYLRFDSKAYSAHRKDFNSYQKWLQEKNNS